MKNKKLNSARLLFTASCCFCGWRENQRALSAFYFTVILLHVSNPTPAFGFFTCRWDATGTLTSDRRQSKHTNHNMTKNGWDTKLPDKEGQESEMTKSKYIQSSQTQRPRKTQEPWRNRTNNKTYWERQNTRSQAPNSHALLLYIKQPKTTRRVSKEPKSEAKTCWGDKKGPNAQKTKPQKAKRQIQWSMLMTTVMTSSWWCHPVGWR